MARQVAPDVSRRPDSSGAAPAHVLPRSGTGWWALALLTLVCLYPVYLGTLDDLVDNGVALILVCTAVIGLALGSAAVALVVRGDRSVLLFLVLTAAVLMLLLGLLFALTLLFLGL